MSKNREKGKAVELSFITYDGAPDPKDRKIRREVRSHVTKLQHRNARERQTHPSAIKFRAIEFKDKSSDARVVLEELRAEQKSETTGVGSSAPLGASDEVDGNGPIMTVLGRSSGAQNARPRSARTERWRRDDSPVSSAHQSSEHLVRLSKLAGNMARQNALGDPADTMASILGRLNLDFPTVMEHYKWIVFAQSPDFERIFMPELQRGAGYETLVSRIARDPALISAAVLIATGHILSIRNAAMSRNIARCIFELKSFVLNTVNEALRDPTRATTDSLICAILILASHEGLQGAHENYHIHMRGLIQMINMRGGLSVLHETHKYLEPFVIWQDTNVSTIMGCEPYWKQATNHTESLPTVKANPGMWLLTNI